jgi:hypothetical protein
LEANEIAAYNAKPATLWGYIYGRFVNADAFGIRHTNSFCQVANGTNTFDGVSTAYIRPTQTNKSFKKLIGRYPQTARLTRV